MRVKTQLRYEHISSYPALFNGPRMNFTAVAETGFSPGERGRKLSPPIRDLGPLSENFCKNDYRKLSNIWNA